MKIFLSVVAVAALAVQSFAAVPNVKRTGVNVLRVASAVVDGETVTVGTVVFEVDTTSASGITAGRQRVNLSGGGTAAATQTLTITALPLTTETVTLDAKIYTFQTTLTNVNGNVTLGATAATAAANLVDAINLGTTAGTDYALAMTLHPTVSAALGTAVAATQTLTSDATAPSNSDTVTVGGKVYTFQTSLTNVDGNVLIGASAAAALDNLKSAINLTTGAGTTYATAMTANTGVSAGTNTDTTQVVTALVAGGAGNLITSTETSSHLAWGAAVLAGGSDKVVVTAKIPGAGANAIASTETVTGSSFGSTTLAGGVSPTAAEFTTAFTAAVNAANVLGFRVGATRISANEVFLVNHTGGSASLAATETLAGSNNAFAASAFYGGSNIQENSRGTLTMSRAANATEEALQTMHFAAPFTPASMTVQVRSAAGVLKAFDGSIINTAGQVDVNGTGSTDIADTDIVTVTLSD